MTFAPVCYALLVMEAAAKHESQHEALLEVIDALEYACAHDFSYADMSIAAYGAGALGALVGRNAGGGAGTVGVSRLLRLKNLKS